MIQHYAMLGINRLNAMHESVNRQSNRHTFSSTGGLIYHNIVCISQDVVCKTCLKYSSKWDLFCGLEVRVPCCRHRGVGVRGPALQHYLSRSGDGTGSSQLGEDK
jgi:hypothetical protein